jgi:hypothetical protein
MLSNAPMQEKSLCIVSLSWIHWRLFCALKPEMRRNFNIFVITMPLCRICLLLLSNQNCGWAIICPLCVALKGSCHRLTCNIQNPCGLECGMSAVCTRNTETVWLFFFSNSKYMGSDFLLCGFSRAIFGEQMRGREMLLSLFTTNQTMWCGDYSVWGW